MPRARRGCCTRWSADAEYEVVITQPGGLLRYRLGDRVAVRGRHRGTPVLAFVGRADAVCDLVGEKLAEPFVADALARAVRADAFATLLPLAASRGPSRYCLLTDDDTPGLDRAVEAALRRGDALSRGARARPARRR